MSSVIESRSVLDTLRTRVSIRKYRDEDVADELLTEMIDAARRSPTSSNLQAYSIVVIRDNVKKEKLASLCGNQEHIITCPVFLVICADLSRVQTACEMEGGALSRNLESTLIATVDAALVGMSLSLAAESLGLGTVMIGGIRNHPRDVAVLLDFTEGVYAVFGLCIGWPETVPQQKPRMDFETIVHHEGYRPTSREELEEYDRKLASHYRSQGRVTGDKAWTGVIGKRMASPRRPHLKGDLEELGFSLT